ncbi:hypothetical protein GXP71_01055 [Cellulomonas sp. H30R-01]|uniref:hypothetical protein n=1 Tax=Cellulomonas sp. H30R-01 TaxID=2704467 RepID=UPI00138C82BC|nr:hypothetical protein [Cellulomonas sp. H30R-01]QHT54823.1 hypothetical protein GXP71_01055 [Cellulomonas sp. H30R-01]
MSAHPTTPDDELVIAGYVVAVPAAAPPGVETSAPDRILTISSCLRDAPTPEFWDWFTDVEEAEQRRRSEAPEATTVTVALPRLEAVRLMSECGGPTQPYFGLLREMVPWSGSALLGFEVVGVEATLSFHSWHCHGYARDVRDALGIPLNDLGLVHRQEDAVRVRDWMLDRPPAEQPAPVPWVVVALADDDAAAGAREARTATAGHDVRLSDRRVR